MRVVITGGHGFLGWHTACRLKVLHSIDAVRLGRAEVEDPEVLAGHVRRADVVVHVAGVNRAASPEAVRAENVVLAERLASAIRNAGSSRRVVYANSTQARLDTPYGRGKAEAADLLRAATLASEGTLVDVLLPNLFGEHGRPHYNSFVATFCHLVATGEQPTTVTDEELPLLHVQTAAAELIAAMQADTGSVIEPSAVTRKVSEVLAEINDFHRLYVAGEIPALVDDFSIDLFNTYRSYTFPEQFPRFAAVHVDARGELFETGRSHGGTSQTFVSITRPGQIRGNHVHLRKVERFYVVRGTAEIALRRLLHDEVFTLTVGGDRPGYVDMPTLWTHSITNVGDDDLVTVFWTDQLLDPEEPDQSPEPVLLEAST